MKLHTFDEICTFLDISEEKLMWKFLYKNNIKLKDARFKFNSCAIGTAIFVTSVGSNEFADITNYDNW